MPRIKRWGPREHIKTPEWILKGGKKPKKHGTRKKRLGRPKKAGRTKPKAGDDFSDAVSEIARFVFREIS